MIHLSDISWEYSGEEAIKNYKVDDLVKFKILEIDLEKERVSLGIKQLSSDPSKSDKIINKIVNCEIVILWMCSTVWIRVPSKYYRIKALIYF